MPALTSINLPMAVPLSLNFLYLSNQIFCSTDSFHACFHIHHLPFRLPLLRRLLRKSESNVEVGRHSLGRATGIRCQDYEGAYCSGSRCSLVCLGSNERIYRLLLARKYQYR